MEKARRVSISLAGFVLICFFLPWVQLSCVGLRDSASGFDLARSGDTLLWLVPVFMLAILLLGVARAIWEKLPAMFAFTAMVGGGLSAFLMYHERSQLNQAPRLVATQWTAVFWLALVACLGVAAASFRFYSRRSRSP